MPATTRIAAALAAALALVGCGGGGAGPAADTTPPAITSATPAHAAAGVAHDVAPRFGFSEAIDVATVTAATVAFEDAFGAAVAYEKAFDGATNVLTLTPAAPGLANFHTYTVTFRTGVKDLAGNGLAAQRSFTFTTVDDVAPAAPGTPAGPGLWATASPVAFGWAAATDDGSGVASYRLEVATATDGTGTSVFSGDVGATLSRAVTAADGQTLYARVAAVDGGGNVGPWSAWSSAVGVDLAAPALAAGVADAGAWDGHLGDATVAFTWGAATDSGSGFAGYELEVALAATGGAVIATASPSTAAYTLDASTLADGAVLYARVRALDVAGNASAWSAWSDGVMLDKAAPGALGRPAGPGAYALASPVRFTWGAASDAVSGVASYDAQVVSATDGSGETFFDASVGNSHVIDVPAADCKKLFARARAVDAAGFVGDWSPWSNEVVVDLQPPTVPGTPADAGAYTESPAHFSWAAATDTNGVASYVLEVTTAPNGGGTVVSSANVGNVLSADVAATDGQTLYARVRAIDVAGRQGNWSASSDGILVDRTGPAAPGTPQHSGAYSGANVVFAWTPADATGSPITAYRLQVSPTADFSSGVVELDVGTATTGTFNATGLDGDTVYARVVAVDGLGRVGPASPTSAGVTIDLSAPTDPGVPQDGGTVQAGRTVHFAWTASTDAGSGVDHYILEIREDGVFKASPSVAAPASSLDYVASTTAGAVVTARVQAFDALGHQSAWSGWSDGIAINDPTVPGTPGTPTHYPAGTYTTETWITFQWTAPPDGAAFDSYVVEVGTAPGANDVYTAVVPSSATSILVVLTEGRTYYAHVVARNSTTVKQGAFSASSDGITIDRTPPSAPGTPIGTYASGRMTWTWSAATDAESGIASYDLVVYMNGGAVDHQTLAATATSYAFDVPPWATSVSAEVSAVNGAGLTGDAALSDTIPIDLQPPYVVAFQPWNGSTNVPTGTDVVIRFSEPMDRASVEAAFSLAYAGAPPKNGYVFAWNGESTEVRIAPDTQDPVGATNVDLLPEKTAVVATVAAAAKDLFGNAMTGAYTSPFTTADDTAPRLLSLKVGGVASPVPAASVQQGGFTLDLAFDEDMDPTRAGVSLSTRNERIEARYGSTQIRNVLLGGGTATYVLDGCADVRVGDVVTVRDVQPRELEVVRAAVTAVNTSGCSFTVTSTATAAYQGGGWAAIPYGNGARPRWTGPRTLSLVFEPWVSLAPGSDSAVEVWDVNDLSGNWPRDARTSLQVRELPGADTTPPALVTSLPRQGGTAPGARMAILRFTEPLDRSTLAGLTAQSSSGAVPYDVQYQNEEFGPMVFVTPRRAAPAGATVTVHVPGTVKDLAGNAMGSAIDLTYTVSPTVDSGKPELLESLPPSGRPVWSVWDAQVAFVDALSGALDPIDATSVGPEDVRVEDETGWLSRGWRPEAEPGSAFVRISPPARGGFSGGPSATTYTIALAGVAGATGIEDAHGNAMDPQVLQVVLQPTGNRVPMVQDLRDLGVSASTSPRGRSLDLELSLRDADTQVVHVSVSIRVAGSDVPLTSYAADVLADPYGSARYRMPTSSGGPPMGDSDPALASLPSGVYPVTITLDDGVDTTTYVREVFLWSPDDVPSLEGVDDGGTVRPMDALHPPVVENGPTPALRWGLASGASPDFLGVYVATLDGVGDQNGGRVEAIVAPPDVTSLTAPSPLATDVYLWTVVQQRFAAGTNDPRSSGWALDLQDLMGSLFVVGPDNRALGGAEFGAARVAFESSGSGTLTGNSDATGLWTVLPAGGAAPVFVSQSMNDQTGTALPTAQGLFAYGAADAAFTVTELPSGAPTPLPTRGGLGGAGAMFAVAQVNESIPSLTAGARRFQTSGFGNALDGTFAFVQLSAWSSGGVFGGVDGSVGTASFGPSSCAVDMVHNDGGAEAVPAVPYTLADDGFLALTVDSGRQARGYVGGAPGAEVAALALDVQPTGTDEHTFWLLMARAYGWTGAETDATLQGEYRFADLSAQAGVPGNQRANGASGTLRFDGLGGFTFAVSSPRGVEVGAGTYQVDAANERVLVEVPKGDGTTGTLTFVVGPEFDTLLGLSTSDPSSTEVLVVTR